MLIVKDLYRCYKPKKGSPVVALDHVNLKFPDTGLIFVLGKSGSGKSTLLNVMGGLDKADSGEIIIKGKSSKDFKQSDFDSYRNTYLGFIFQEYNILNEFNVGQNIALALELQGRKATSDEVNKILEEVDLSGYGSRKINELSGGQKQRVAIARALVKNPEIIFADEPTGALDSKTGLAVFETLKKLAQTKLVIVVSHDREFAEYFGDRVIELADGKVISDIEKTTVPGDIKSEGITIIDDKVLKIKKNYKLTSKDIQLIAEYLNRNNEERFISFDERINTNIKKEARIDNEGNKESFKDTNQEEINNTPGIFKSIKSKLSLKHCFKIGGSSLKIKPFRLFLTILLAVFSFGLFGLSDTLGSYDKINSTLKSIKEQGIDSVVLENNKVIKESDYSYTNTTKSDDEDILKLNETYGIDFQGIYDLNHSSIVDNLISKSMSYMDFYVSELGGLYSSLDSEFISNNNFELHGNYPENENEIAITLHIYETFKKFGYRNNEIEIKPEAITINELIGKEINIPINNRYESFIITGIIDTKFDTSNYESLKNIGASNSFDAGTYMKFQQYIDDYKFGYHTLLYCSPATSNKYFNDSVVYLNSGINIKYPNENFNYYNIVKRFISSDNIIMKDNNTTLNDNEYIVNIDDLYLFDKNNMFSDIVAPDNSVNNKYDINYLSDVIFALGIDKFVYVFASDILDESLDNGFEPKDWWGNIIPEEDREGQISALRDYILNLYYDNNTEDFSYSTKNFFEERINYLREIIIPNLDFILDNLGNLNLSYHDNIFYNQITETYKVVGISLDHTNEDYVYLNDNDIKKLSNDDGIYSFLISNLPNDDILEKIIIANYNEENAENFFKLRNKVMPSYEQFNSVIESLSKAFLYIGIAFAVFAALMLFNFITISISYKKREIGILRALGSRSKDVFNIFFAESFIIAMISYTLAIMGIFIFSNYLNVSFQEEFALGITLFLPGLRQIVLVLAVCLTVAFVSTFLPVYKIAMKKPIDAIRER